MWPSQNIWTLQILQLPQNYNTIHINILELILTIQFRISFVFVYHPVVHKCGHLRAPNYRIFSMLHIIYKVSWIPTFLFNDGQLGPSASLLMWSVGCGCWLHNGHFFVNPSGWLNSLNKCHHSVYDVLSLLNLWLAKKTRPVSIFHVGDRVFWPTKGTGSLKHHIFLFLIENSILKIFGSVDVKITPDFCS